MTDAAPILSQYATSYHKPVLIREVLHYLDPKPGGVYIDATLGGGGHSKAILEASAPSGRLISIDRDPEAIKTASERLASFGDRFTPVQANYSDIPDVMQAHGLTQIDGLLLDAGVSSHQLDTPERGFSFRNPGPLDMRLGSDAQDLASLLDSSSWEKLAAILGNYGEVKQAGRLARAIKHAFEQGVLHDTSDLAAVVEQNIHQPRGKRRKRTHPATQVFQALRIAVNDELGHLERVIDAFPSWLTPGTGRGVFISFHSLEDRIVKQGLKRHLEQRTTLRGLPHDISTQPAKISLLTKKGIPPKEDEVLDNPRSRSAKLRAAQAVP